MKEAILTIFTRTPLHVGAGTSVGAVDQPVIRERHTRLPVIPGSSIKGVLADLWSEREQAMDKEGKPRVHKADKKPVMIRTGDGRFLFGSDDSDNPSAGALLIGEGRLLAFPVRSAKGGFAWLTCPLVLSRFQRDFPKTQFNISQAGTLTANVHTDSRLALETENGEKAVFEEYALEVRKDLPEELINAFIGLCPDSMWTESLKSRLALVSDDLFFYFAENACEVAQHVRINDETGTAAKGALFNQENVPSESLFYSVLTAQQGKGESKDSPPEKAMELLQGMLSRDSIRNVLQIGADQTTGLGWCSVQLVDNERASQ